jgi:hypothetical protein
VKHLFVEYTTDAGNKIVLFDDEVAEVTWSDSASGVRVEGKTQAAAAGGGMGGLLDLLTGASKARTEAVIEEKKASLVEAVVEAPTPAETPADSPAVQVIEEDSIEVIQAAQA